MMLFKKTLISFIICLSSLICYGEGEEESLDSVFFQDFDDDSYFVTIPTYTGNYLGLIIGAVPAACVAAGFQFANETPATVRKSAQVTLSVFSKSIGLLCGLPFKFIKMALWDSPQYVLTGLTGDSDPPIKLPENREKTGL
ncbi:MAG: hypothetical protein WC082_04760 [Victivallales bacterium]